MEVLRGVLLRARESLHPDLVGSGIRVVLDIDTLRLEGAVVVTQVLEAELRRAWRERGQRAPPS